MLDVRKFNSNSCVMTAAKTATATATATKAAAESRLLSVKASLRNLLKQMLANEVHAYLLNVLICSYCCRFDLNYLKTHMNSVEMQSLQASSTLLTPQQWLGKVQQACCSQCTAL
jgi:hypothetical protein